MNELLIIPLLVSSNQFSFFGIKSTSSRRTSTQQITLLLKFKNILYKKEAGRACPYNDTYNYTISQNGTLL